MISQNCLVLLLSIAFFLATTGCKQENKPADASQESISASESAPVPEDTGNAEEDEDTTRALSALSGMQSLAAGDTAFELGGNAYSWNQVYAYLSKSNILRPTPLDNSFQPDQLTNGLTPPQQNKALTFLKRTIRRMVLLKEAQAQGITVTNAEKQAFIDSWRKNISEENLNEFLARLPEKASSPFDISATELFVVAKYTDGLTRDVTVPESAIASILSQFQAVQKNFAKLLADRRKEFAALAEDPSINTDEGFAKLARDCSDGKESINNGIIDVPLTRAEIAILNGDQPFTTAVGQTSPLIETSTSLRYIRVLGSVPGEMPGEPERLRIAQILHTKRVLEDMPNRDDIQKRLEFQYKEQKTAAHLAELLKKYNFKCQLCPSITDNWPLDVKTDKAIPTR